VAADLALARRADAIHAAVFGACIARQVFDWLADGRGGPGDREMEHFVEEAETIADMAVAALETAPVKP